MKPSRKSSRKHNPKSRSKDGRRNVLKSDEWNLVWILFWKHVSVLRIYRFVFLDDTMAFSRLSIYYSISICSQKCLTGHLLSLNMRIGFSSRYGGSNLHLCTNTGVAIIV
jgi:hypothetical protein